MGQMVGSSKRNPNAIQIGLTATPRKLMEAKDQPQEDAENHRQQLRLLR
jgi:hypothetical protein